MIGVAVLLGCIALEALMVRHLMVARRLRRDAELDYAAAVAEREWAASERTCAERALHRAGMQERST